AAPPPTDAAPPATGPAPQDSTGAPTADATTTPNTNMARDANTQPAPQTDQSNAMQSAQNPDASAYASTPADAQPAGGMMDDMQLARDAGMSAAPMTPQQVCTQRTVTLSDHAGMTRMQKARFAVDRASACKMQNLVIKAPGGEASRLR